MPPTEKQPIARRDLIQALLPHVGASTRIGLLTFAREYALFLAGFALALFAEPWWLRLIGSLVAGLKITSLYTLSHDASHYSLVEQRWLNRALGTFGFMHGLLNYRLWQYDHIDAHHPRTNGPQRDIHRPMSLADYRAAPAWRRAWERFARSWNPLGRVPYFIVGSRWLTEKFVPNPRIHPPKVRREAWPAALLLIGWVGGLLAWFWVRRHGDVPAFARDALFGLVVPVYLFQMLTCVVTAIQHLHPDVPWFDEGDERFETIGQEEITINWRVPYVLGKLMHFSLDHAVHHVLPAIPSRNLRAAQDKMNALLTAAGRHHVVVPLTYRTLRDVYVRCKLYDYENHRWLDFDGNPTSGVLVDGPRVAAQPLAA